MLGVLDLSDFIVETPEIVAARTRPVVGIWRIEM